MPSLPNRNDRKKKRDRSETLIIPHITKDMLEKARAMAEQGASRAEIEQAMLEMQAARNPAAQPAQPQTPDPHRIVPTSRPRLTEEERAAMRAQMQEEQARQQEAQRAEATRSFPRVDRPAPAAPPRPAARPAAPAPARTASQPAPAGQGTQATRADRPQAGERPAGAARPQGTPAGARPAQAPAAPAATAAPAAQTANPPRHRAGLLQSRAQAEAALKEKIRSDHIWLSNPVLVRGLGLAPIVGAALDGRHAGMLCLASLLLITLTRVLAVAVCHISRNRFRTVIYCYCAALLYIPVYVLLYDLFGSGLNVLGIYLPILVVEPVVIKRMEFTELEPLRDALRHGFNNSLGMCVALLIVGCLRELLATGAVFGHTLLSAAPLPLAAQPAGGFVLVGVLAAVWCAAANAYTEYKQEEVRRLYASRKH